MEIQDRTRSTREDDHLREHVPCLKIIIIIIIIVLNELQSESALLLDKDRRRLSPCCSSLEDCWRAQRLLFGAFIGTFGATRETFSLSLPWLARRAKFQLTLPTHEIPAMLCSSHKVSP